MKLSQDIKNEINNNNSVENELMILKKLNAAANALTASDSFDDSLKVFLENCMDLVKSINGSIMLLDENINALKICASKGLSDKTINKSLVFSGEGISGKILLNNCHILCGNKSNLILNKRSEERNFSFLSMPLIYKKRVIGVLNLSCPSDRDEFSEKDYKLIKPLAALAAMHIENYRLIERFNLITHETIRSFIHALAIKDSETEGHCQRVMHYSYSIAREYGCFTEKDLVILQYGAMLHDIGKIGIGNDILLKPDKLSDREYEEIKKHPELGSSIISPISNFDDVKSCILHHHSWYNEKGGYPAVKLSNKKLKLMTNIIGVADVYDAMSSARPYRDKINYEEIKKILINGKNIQFDPMAVDILINQVENNRSYKKDPPFQNLSKILIN